MFADAGFGYSPPLDLDLDFSFSFSSAPAAAAAAAADTTTDDAIYAQLTSLISGYDLGGEGDLFKAPQPIIDEPPLLGLDPVAAAISMMSGGDAIKASSMGLSEVQLYEYEMELMEKSAIEETISELLVKIPMLQVEEAVDPRAAGASSLMNGTSVVRPNFLDFGGLDFEAAFGLRRAYSEGDIQNLGSNNPQLGNSGNVERLVTISDLKTEQRKQKLSMYRKKKMKRNFGRKIKYACRKALADSQPRVRGRFAKMDDGDMLRPGKL